MVLLFPFKAPPRSTSGLKVGVVPKIVFVESLIRDLRRRRRHRQPPHVLLIAGSPLEVNGSLHTRRPGVSGARDQFHI
jgi:hypothetical protein